jgi:hypothetical protein
MTISKPLAEQELLCQLIDKPALPKLVVDISDNSAPKTVEKIADWLEQTGGLYM